MWVTECVGHPALKLSGRDSPEIATHGEYQGRRSPQLPRGTVTHKPGGLRLRLLFFFFFVFVFVFFQRLSQSFADLSRSVSRAFLDFL